MHIGHDLMIDLGPQLVQLRQRLRQPALRTEVVDLEREYLILYSLHQFTSRRCTALADFVRRGSLSRGQAVSACRAQIADRSVESA
ncbi:hypothetical protein D3C73_1259870 [compost metagenome]